MNTSCRPHITVWPELRNNALRMSRQNRCGSFFFQSSLRAGELGANRWRSLLGIWCMLMSSKTTKTYFESGLGLERARCRQPVQWLSRRSSRVTHTTMASLDLKARTKLSTCEATTKVGYTVRRGKVVDEMNGNIRIKMNETRKRINDDVCEKYIHVGIIGKNQVYYTVLIVDAGCLNRNLFVYFLISSNRKQNIQFQNNIGKITQAKGVNRIAC